MLHISHNAAHQLKIAKELEMATQKMELANIRKI
jgi:hypothetical protein